ncbi:hypothetical protein GE061_012161 [Apolygus lucorum]|uniref:Uncharacterized protein n=1 Tax=Apolygus lucorum TaxID=248454 RepID=A0A8S9XTS8_APOLU|nr:hypothetical protein GE061_012161 [Apolygus lucorum]
MWWLGLALLGAVAASIHDNRIGSPEAVLSVEDPSSSLFNIISPMPYTGEVDSRGFHGGMFDGIGDYYPAWPSVYYKRFYK